MGAGGQEHAMSSLNLGKRPSLFYNGYQVSFPGVKRPGRGVDRQTTRHLASPKMGTCFCFLQKVQFNILPCTLDHISFTDKEKKDQSQHKLSQILCIYQKCIESFQSVPSLSGTYTGVCMYFFQTVHSKFFFLMCATCCGSCFEQCSCL